MRGRRAEIAEPKLADSVGAPVIDADHPRAVSGRSKV